MSPQPCRCMRSRELSLLHPTGIQAGPGHAHIGITSQAVPIPGRGWRRGAVCWPSSSAARCSNWFGGGCLGSRDRSVPRTDRMPVSSCCAVTGHPWALNTQGDDAGSASHLSGNQLPLFPPAAPGSWLSYAQESPVPFLSLKRCARTGRKHCLQNKELGREPRDHQRAVLVTLAAGGRDCACSCAGSTRRAHRAGSVRMQQSQAMVWEELSFFPVTHVASVAPSLPALLSPGPHPALERGRPAPLQLWSRGCRCLRQ